MLAAVQASGEVFDMMLSFCDGECCFWRALSYTSYWKTCTLRLCVTNADSHDQGMEVHASDREIVEAAVAQDGKLRAHNCERGATYYCFGHSRIKLEEWIPTLTDAFVLYKRRILPLFGDDQLIIPVMRRQLAEAREQ